MDKRFLEWLCCGDVGRSSKVIAFVMFGLQPEMILEKHWPSYPADAGDFSRCYKLLKIFPEWRERITEMKCLGKIWGRIADNWNRLECLYETGANDKLYDLLQKLQPDEDEKNCNKVTIGKISITTRKE